MFDPHYDTVLIVAYTTAVFSALASVFVIAPYGRFGTNAFGFELNPRFGWWLMEIMATLSFVYYYPQGKLFWLLVRKCNVHLHYLCAIRAQLFTARPAYVCGTLSYPLCQQRMVLPLQY